MNFNSVICLASFLCICLFLSCDSKEPKVSTQLLVGTYRISDQRLPFPYFIEESLDSLRVSDIENNVLAKASGKLLSIQNQDTFDIDSFEFVVQYKNDNKWYLQDLNDPTRFPRHSNGAIMSKNAARFIQPRQYTFKENEATVLDILKTKIWTYWDKGKNPNTDLRIKNQITFENDHAAWLKSYYYQDRIVFSEKEILPHSILKKKGMMFLSFTDKSELEHRSILQILELSTNQLIFRNFDEREFKDIRLKGEKKHEDYKSKLEATEEFMMCFPGHQGEYYYVDEVTHNKGNEYIMREFRRDAPIGEGDGYIIMHFTVNCKSQTGNFGLIQMDDDFEVRKFDYVLVAHLLQKTKKLRDWPSSVSEYTHIYYHDVHAFLMVKIRDGKIVDLCP